MKIIFQRSLDGTRQRIRDTGSIIVYNKAFEIGILSDLADAFPEYQIWVEDVWGMRGWK